MLDKRASFLWASVGRSWDCGTSLCDVSVVASDGKPARIDCTGMAFDLYGLACETPNAGRISKRTGTSHICSIFRLHAFSSGANSQKWKLKF